MVTDNLQYICHQLVKMVVKFVFTEHKYKFRILFKSPFVEYVLPSGQDLFARFFKAFPVRVHHKR
jgi:hypothetical protein